MMSGCHQKLIYIIIFYSLNTFDTSSATVLAAEIIHGHSFDISFFCHGYHGILPGNHILSRNIVNIITDFCFSLITVFFSDRRNFFTNYPKQHIMIPKNDLIFMDFLQKLLVFIFNFFSFQTCQSTQTHIYDSLGLGITETKLLHESCFGNLGIL